MGRNYMLVSPTSSIVPGTEQVLWEYWLNYFISPHLQLKHFSSSFHQPPSLTQALATTASKLTSLVHLTFTSFSESEPIPSLYIREQLHGINKLNAHLYLESRGVLCHESLC